MTDSKMLLPLHTDTVVFCLRRLDTRGVENFFVCYGNKPGRHFARKLTRVWSCPLGGTGGESVNSAGYSLIE